MWDAIAAKMNVMGWLGNLATLIYSFCRFSRSGRALFL